MSVYSCQGTQTAAAKTALVVVSTAAIRPRIIDATFMQIGTPGGDASYEVHAKRFTAAGTTTPTTPASTDPNDPAATFLSGSNATVEPTFTANTLIRQFAHNPRASFRWVAYDQRAEMILPATAANGIGFLVNGMGGAVTILIDASVLQ
jgi:hypothetical protein